MSPFSEVPVSSETANIVRTLNSDVTNTVQLIGFGMIALVVVAIIIVAVVVSKGKQKKINY